MRVLSLRGKPEITARVSGALIALIMFAPMGHTQTGGGTIGNVPNNRGIVTQGQKGDNYLTLNLVAYHGDAIISPPSQAGCASNRALSAQTGNSVFIFTNSEFSPLLINGNPVLTLKRTVAGLTVNALRIVDKNSNMIAWGQDGHISYLAGARSPQVTKSSISLYDLEGDEILRLSYLDNCAITISGSFGVNGQLIKVDANGDTTSGAYRGDHNFFENIGLDLGRRTAAAPNGVR